MCARLAILAAACVGAGLGGCLALPERNAIVADARPGLSAEIERMRAEPKGLARPVIVLNGYRAPSIFAEGIVSRLRRMTGGEVRDVLLVSYPFSGDLDAMAAEVIGRVQGRWPSGSEEETVEVDVVGLSMGGVVARWAALPPAERVREGDTRLPAPGARLRIARLFTISSPNRGARAAGWMALDGATEDVRPGSPLLRTLDACFAESGYEMVCYGQLGDSMVGATRSAPEGVTPIWSSGTVMFSHFSSSLSDVFLADIARRLRGEEPLLRVGEPPPGN